jgi:putative oxidoreductase
MAHLLDASNGLLIARTLLVCMFPFSACDKILNWHAALKQANSSFLPGGQVLLILAIMIEAATPICIIANWHAPLAAGMLAAFCVATALLYHPFWTQGDFWTQGESVARTHFWDFTKNLGLTGGLLLVALGAGS